MGRCASILVFGALVFAAPVALASSAPGPLSSVAIDRTAMDGRVFVIAGFSSFLSSLEFDTVDIELQQQTIGLAAGYQFGASTTLSLGLGLVLGGELELHGDAREFDIDRGSTANLHLARHFEVGARWFVIGELAGAIARVTSAEELDDGTELGSESYTGYDARAGVVVGYELGRMLRPFLVARGLAGKSHWTIDGNPETSSPNLAAQLGLGLAVDIPLGFSISVEAIPLGDRRLAVAVFSRL